MGDGEDGLARVMGPWGEVRSVPEAVQRMAETRMNAVLKNNQWLERLGGAVGAIVKADVTHKKRLQMLRSLADRVNNAVSPQAACKKGCDACCKIQVEISAWEARLIGAELGLRVMEPSEVEDSRARSLDLMGSACGFLKEGQCSIYESRPIACRLHHSLSDDASMCQMDVKPEESMVPAMNLVSLKAGYAVCSGSTRFNDIRDFFVEARCGVPPSEKAGTMGADGGEKSDG